MFFQVLDNKHECIGFYANGKLIFDESHEYVDKFSKTWSYSVSFDKNNVEYGKVLTGGKKLEDICPENLKEEWKSTQGKIKAYQKAFKTAKVDLNKNCFYDLLPEYFLYEYFDLRNKITEHAFENYNKQENYEFMVKVSKLIEQIRYQPLNINYSKLKEYQKKYPKNYTLKNVQDFIKYDMWSSKTGRLTANKDSFPILNLESKFKDILYPQNHYFVELDFNSAELRTFLGLLGNKQPDVDIHLWNKENILGDDSMSRNDLKKEIFSWLYNPYSNISDFEEVYNRDKVKSEYFDGSQIKNIFGRTIESDDYHALSYIVQSTSNDLMLNAAIRINEFLKDKQTRICGLIHDSVVLDFHKNELHHAAECAKLMSDTRLGEFLVNVQAGKNFGSLKTINL